MPQRSNIIPHNLASLARAKKKPVSIPSYLAAFIYTHFHKCFLTEHHANTATANYMTLGSSNSTKAGN